MQLAPYLIFHGQCEAAFIFYKRVLGAKIEAMMTHGDSPMAQQVPRDWRNKVIHARILIGNDALMASDAPSDRYQKPQGFSVSLGVKEVAEAERVFKELSHNGQVPMPSQKTFWSARFGMLVDPYGIP
jgi:PhnB protein